MNNKKAFTLIELLAVVVIIGLLVAIAYPAVNKYIEETKDTTYTLHESDMKTAAKNMMSECRTYSNKVWGQINKELQAQQEPIVKEKEEKAKKEDEENAQNEENAAFLEDVKKMINIRRTYSEIFEYFPKNHRRSNICEVEATGFGTLQNYARFMDNRAVLIVANNNADSVVGEITVYSLKKIK